MRLQILGLCRFSYPSNLEAFQKDHADEAALRAYLYAEDRMEGRFYFFEELVVPTIRAQTDKDFRVVVLAGDQMPTHYRQRLEAAVAGCPQFDLRFEPEGQNHADLCRRLMVDARDQSADWVAEFRLDDDDAVALDFVATIRAMAPAVTALAAASPEVRAALDFAMGFVLYAKRRELDILPVLARLWTPALVMVNRPDHPKSLLDTRHLRLWQRFPVISSVDHPMFIRGAHDDNDSSVEKRKLQKFRIDPFDIPAKIEDRFGLDLDRMETRWRLCPARKKLGC
ncbi:hypothetical protein HJ526_03420 [Donghicola sp. C2-DW-16]|uniref:Rhamnosyl transferase n=1 Tax=Donghicola mangrovi TaxID=2729614 RepID=A0ABX2PBP5_9RHOB|nr:glycosyltransferase [Donghicola mangrovi]NVO26459.1 hypothetical protein [Donghicola mangrovi]